MPPPLVSYDPTHSSSGESFADSAELSDLTSELALDSGSMDQSSHGRDLRRRITRAGIVLNDDEIDLLRLITATSDRRRTPAVTLDTRKHFPEFFQMFEAFMSRNGFDPSSASYKKCLNIVIGLCGYQEDTWATRLDHCLSELTTTNQRRQRRNTLKEQTEQFHKLSRKRVLDNWRIYTHHCRNLNEIALSRDLLRLQTNTFRLWRQRQESVTKLGTKAHKIATLSALTQGLSVIKERATLVKRRNDQSALMARGKAFDQWYKRYQLQTRRNLMSTNWYHHRLASSYLVDWVYSAIDSRVRTNYARSLAMDILTTWRAKAQRVQNLSKMAERHNLQRTLGPIVEGWKVDTNTIWNNWLVAEEMDTVYCTKHALGEWQRMTQLCQRESIVLASVFTRTAANALALWRNQTRLVREANRFRNYMLQRRALLQWRSRKDYELVDRATNYRLVTEKFRVWQLQTRRSALERYFAKNLAHRTIVHWRDKRIDTIESAMESMALVEYTCTRSRAQQVLQLWINKTESVLAAEEEADLLRYHNLLRSGLYTMMGRIKELHSCESYINQRIGDKKTRKYISIWRSKAIDRRKNRLDQMVAEFERQRDQHLLSRVFNEWATQSWQLASLGQHAEDMYQQISRRRAHRALLEWNSKMSDIDQMQDHADEIYELSLMPRALDVWTKRKQAVDRLNLDMEFVLLNKTWSKAEQCFRAWSMKHFKLQSKKRDADLLLEKFVAARTRRIWRNWRTRCRLSWYGDEETVTDDRAVLETPSRVRSKARLQFASVDRWQQTRSARFSPVRKTPIVRFGDLPTRLKFDTPALELNGNETLDDSPTRARDTNTN
uniref:ARAD1C03696p n=1 Tax=Blastobotrys adeninivorans TaxID=409370 RepID=A0A060T586_BLAAD